MMIKDKPWKSFAIFDIRHQEEFKVVKIILENLGYRYDGIQLGDYKNCICFFPGRDENMEEFSVTSTQEEQETEEGCLKIFLANMIFECFFNVKDFIKWYNKNKLN